MNILYLIFKTLAILCAVAVVIIVVSIGMVLHAAHIASENDKERFWGENNPNKRKNNQ